MVGQVIGPVQIGDIDPIGIEIDAADGAVVQDKPGLHAESRLAPGGIQEDEHQMDEKSSVAENGDPVFGCSFAVTVAGEQIG